MGVYQPMRGDGYDDVPAKELPPKAVLAGFVGQTTSHGIPHVNQARGMYCLKTQDVHPTLALCWVSVICWGASTSS